MGPFILGAHEVLVQTESVNEGFTLCRLQQLTGAAGTTLSSVRAIEEEEMALFAESKESSSAAHSSSTNLTKLSCSQEEGMFQVVQFILSAVYLQYSTHQ
ncbi:hypothetical protein TREES_T100005174 [Tupaia chinensis]|uniref:Uncharacterized protein n=1 Tax=Tupaia chinensis TaxID=246437 RepID=L9L1C1_TUPCH|nr:hypothetical protein TREES_T100005174 [Tupaia chinensis]